MFRRAMRLFDLTYPPIPWASHIERVHASHFAKCFIPEHPSTCIEPAQFEAVGYWREHSVGPVQASTQLRVVLKATIAVFAYGMHVRQHSWEQHADEVTNTYNPCLWQRLVDMMVFGRDHRG